jgi:hypothetical protein
MLRVSRVSLVLGGTFHKSWNNRLTRLKCHGDNIQHNDLDALLCQQLNHLAANASRSTSNQHNLLVPVIFIGCPIVQHAGIKVVGGPADEAKVEELSDSRIGCLVEDREIISLLRISYKK